MSLPVQIGSNVSLPLTGDLVYADTIFRQIQSADITLDKNKFILSAITRTQEQHHAGTTPLPGLPPTCSCQAASCSPRVSIHCEASGVLPP